MKIRKLFLTLKIRNILVTLRPMKQHWRRVKIHIPTSFKTAIKSGGGYPKERMHRTATH